MFRFSVLPKRWIRVTAPVWAVLRENPAFFDQVRGDGRWLDAGAQLGPAGGVRYGRYPHPDRGDLHVGHEPASPQRPCPTGECNSPHGTRIFTIRPIIEQAAMTAITFSLKRNRAMAAARVIRAEAQSKVPPKPCGHSTW